MKKNKDILKTMLGFIGFLFLYVLIITIFNYFDILGSKSTNIINFIFITSIMFTSGFYLATKYTSKGYKAGLIMGIVNLGLLLIISLILRSEISGSTLLYLLILLLSSTIGGMAGINFNCKSK